MKHARLLVYVFVDLMFVPFYNQCLFGCLRRALVVTKGLGDFFVSSERVLRVSYPRSGRKLEDMK